MEDEENETQLSTNQTSDRREIKVAVNPKNATTETKERYALWAFLKQIPVIKARQNNAK